MTLSAPDLQRSKEQDNGAEQNTADCVCAIQNIAHYTGRLKKRDQKLYICQRKNIYTVCQTMHAHGPSEYVVPP
jgi:hypothetical protein